MAETERERNNNVIPVAQCARCRFPDGKHAGRASRRGWINDSDFYGLGWTLKRRWVTIMPFQNAQQYCLWTIMLLIAILIAEAICAMSWWLEHFLLTLQFLTNLQSGYCTQLGIVAQTLSSYGDLTLVLEKCDYSDIMTLHILVGFYAFFFICIPFYFEYILIVFLSWQSLHICEVYSTYFRLAAYILYRNDYRLPVVSIVPFYTI